MLKWSLIGFSLFFIILFLIFPLAYIVTKAFSDGFYVYLSAFTQAEALSAIKLTALAIGVSVLCNTLFALSAAWALGKFNFKAKALILSLIDLPFTISPVVSGLLFILLFGRNSPIYDWLMTTGLSLTFSVPGILVVTTFVTFPFIIREILPVVQAQGTEEEIAALTLGANGWQTFWRITLPNMKWGLIYGMTLSAARAAGEFGAVSVISGHIRGKTMTVPLHIEALYNEYQLTAAYALATLLVLVSMILIILKQIFHAKKDVTT
jgi:sulfate transport system permease protein